LLERLDEEELEGVLAHEMSHIRNYDVRLMTWAAVLAGSIALLANVFTRALWFGGGDRREGNNPIVLIGVIAGLVLAPIAAILIQFAISRRREYVADASGAELTRYPQGLASALHAISAANKPSPRLGNQAIAHLMIAPPLTARGRTMTLFATHPATGHDRGRRRFSDAACRTVTTGASPWPGGRSCQPRRAAAVVDTGLEHNSHGLAYGESTRQLLHRLLSNGSQSKPHSPVRFRSRTRVTQTRPQ